MRKGGKVFILSDSYQIASELAFYGKGHPVTYCVNLGRRMNQYDLWPDFYGLINSDAIFVTIGDAEMHPKVKDSFGHYEKRLLRVYDKDRLLKKYSVFLCYGFKGMKREKVGSY